MVKRGLLERNRHGWVKFNGDGTVDPVLTYDETVYTYDQGGDTNSIVVYNVEKIRRRSACVLAEVR